MKKIHNSCRGVKRTSKISVSIYDSLLVVLEASKSDMGWAKSAQIAYFAPSLREGVKKADILRSR